MTDPFLNKQHRQFLTLWPAIKGSLALVRKPCIRSGCPTCASGRKHPAYILAFSQDGKRRCMYVPVQLVPKLRQYLRNGRKLEKLLFTNGPAILKHYRRSIRKS